MERLKVHAGCFRADDIERHAQGAGIVPVSRAPDGTVHLLLGRERYLPHWRGSCRWSGFEGSRKPFEDLATTAEREFAEESLGVLPAPLHAHWIRVVLRIHHERRTAERYHATWVVPVPWDADAPTRFLETRLDLEHVDRALQEWRYARPTDILGTDRVVGEVCEGGDDVRVRFGETVYSPWDVREAEDVVVRGVDAVRVREWERHRQRVERTLCEHASVTVVRDGGGWLQDASVHMDHLEKDHVRWWSVDELQHVLDGRGHHGTDRFRPYFLPVLQTILKELSLAPPRFGP